MGGKRETCGDMAMYLPKRKEKRLGWFCIEMIDEDATQKAPSDTAIYAPNARSSCLSVCMYYVGLT